LDEVLANETAWPLQQTLVIPYAWKFYSWQKKVTARPSFVRQLQYFFQRGLEYVLVEILPHIYLRLILKMRRPQQVIINYYRQILPKLLQSVTVVNPDYKALTLHTRYHWTFRHVEMEIFIPEVHMRPAFEVIRQVVDWFAGITDTIDPQLLPLLQGLKGKYVLDYTMFIRKVFKDDTLMGMTSTGTCYAMGFFTFYHEADRAGYYLFTKTLAKILNQMFDARPHWGKHFPLTHADLIKVYPDMEKFKSIAQHVDPKGVFQNDFTKQIFGQ